ncbi:hypothetical protein KBD20_03625 [Candidatus Saccharibacteria bacterium]|nr:hypothetical protein [Candidatus Saccharibacteria bacterium]
MANFVNTLTDRVVSSLDLAEPATVSESEKRGIRAVSILQMGVFSVLGAISFQRFGYHLTSIENISPFSTTSDSTFANGLVGLANAEFIKIHLAADIFGITAAGLAVSVANNLRNRYAPDTDAYQSEM